MNFATLLGLLKYVPLIIQYAPKVKKAFEDGKPVFDAIKEYLPKVMPLIKEIAGQVLPDLAHKGETIVAKLVSGIELSHDEKQLWEQQTGKPFDTMHDFTRPTGEQ